MTTATMASDRNFKIGDLVEDLHGDGLLAIVVKTGTDGLDHDFYIDLQLSTGEMLRSFYGIDNGPLLWRKVIP